MSEAEQPPTPADIPSDAVLEKGLRDAVANIFKSGNRDDLTVKRMRLATEKALSLPDDFFKGHTRWKEESARVIKDEAEAQEEAQGTGASQSSPVAPKPKPKTAPPKPLKRSSPDESSKPNKRPKTTSTTQSEDDLSSIPSDVGPSDKSDSSEFSEVEEKKPKKSAPKTAKKAKGKPPTSKKSTELAGDDKKSSELSEKAEEVPKATSTAKSNGVDHKDESESDLSEVIDEEPKPKKKQQTSEGAPKKTATAKSNGADHKNQSESELSEVLDEEPKPRKKRKSSEGQSEKLKKSKKQTASKPKDESNLTPDEAEIKRLQSWLVKCGIRKMWFRELAPYDTPKAKIHHLKGMLKDAGMDGRYSAEKAKQIKEKRELEADLGAVQEGAKRWGTVDEKDRVDEEGRPKRRLAKGLKALQVLSDDGEETD